MTVFHDRRTAQYSDLSGGLIASGQSRMTIQEHNRALNAVGLSGGQFPSRPDESTKYPVDQTTAVVNMR